MLFYTFDAFNYYNLKLHNFVFRKGSQTDVELKGSIFLITG